MKKVEIEVAEWDELEESVKEKLLETKFSDFNTDYDWWDSEYDYQIHEVLEPLGFSGIEISFSGFQNPGDGASFTTKNLDVLKWLTAKKRRTHYRRLLKYLKDFQSCIIKRPFNLFHRKNLYVRFPKDLANELEDEISRDVRDLCRAIYRSLQDEYEGLSSREVIEDTIRANDYKFLKDGTILPI